MKGNHPPINPIYSKELRNLIDLMLSVNPKNRPTISFILERPFIKKRVASYIFDFIQNYTIDPKTDIEDIHIEILKEQAEKLGIFNQLLLKEINPYDENSEKAIKQINNSKEQNFMSYMSYLNKKQEEKKKIEEKIVELEKQKKQIYANIRGRDIRKNTDKESSSVDKKNHYENLKLISSSVERKKAIGKIDRENIKKIPKKIISEADEFIKIKSNIGINNNNNNNSIYSIRPESHKRTPRKTSGENQEITKSVLLAEDLNESLNNNIISNSKSKFADRALKTKYNPNTKDINLLDNSIRENEKLRRPSSGVNNKTDIKRNNTNSNSKTKNIPGYQGSGGSNLNNNYHSHNNLNSNNNIIALNNSRENNQISMIKKEDSFDENILETIREEVEGDKLNADKVKILTLTKEIVKMREYLDQMQNKISTIEKQMVDKNKSKNDTLDQIKDYNESYLNSNEGYIINTNYANYYQYNSNEIDEVNTEVSDVQDENEDKEKNPEKEKPEDDGSNKINERIKILRQ